MALDPLLTPEHFAAGTNGVISPDDSRVPGIVGGASQAVRTYCGWHIAPVISETLTVDGPGGSELTLPTLRVVAVREVRVEGVALAESDYDWSESGQIRLRCGEWPRRYRAVEVDVDHGFDAPADVMQVVQQVATNAISSSMGATREQAGSVSITWALTAPNVSGGVSLLQRDLAILDAYKIRRA